MKAKDLFDLVEKETSGRKEAEGLSEVERCLLLLGVKRWEEAHEICQEMPNQTGSWLHALCHRQEGDDWNADYWYGQAGRSKPEGLSIEEEWRQIVEELLGESNNYFRDGEYRE